MDEKKTDLRLKLSKKEAIDKPSLKTLIFAHRLGKDGDGWLRKAFVYHDYEKMEGVIILSVDDNYFRIGSYDLPY